MALKIGFQGISGSYSERAAIEFMAKRNIDSYELIPLIRSKNVVEKLRQKDIDCGVLALKNNTGGVVKESLVSLCNENFRLNDTLILPIKHAAFKKKSNINNNSIKLVISHEQAIKQCKANIERHFPNAEIEEIDDTALGARELSENKYDDYTAVICSMKAGEKYGLNIAAEPLQDREDNRTEFRLYRNYKPKKEHKPSFLEVLINLLLSKSGFIYTTRGVMFIIIISVIIFRDYLGWNTLKAGLIGSGTVAIFLSFLTSDWLKNKIQYKYILEFSKNSSLIN